MYLGIDKERFCLRLRGALGKCHRFRGRGGLIEQRGVGDVKPGEIADHGLEIEQGFQPALTDFRLVGRVGRIPGRILQDVALDHRRQNRPCIAHSDQRGEHPVPGRKLAHVRQRVGFAQGRAEIERQLLPDRRRQGLSHQFARTFDPDGFQHRVDVARRGTDVAAHEGRGGILGGLEVHGHGWFLGYSTPSYPAKAGYPGITGGCS